MTRRIGCGLRDDPNSMPSTKRIVCLANSRKKGGRCIAGKELGARHPWTWIRPIGHRESEEVLKDECRYDVGGDPQLLDIMEVPLLEESPKDHQCENWLLDAKRRWIRVGTLANGQLPELIDEVSTLWINGYHTKLGCNDEIPFDRAKKLDSSPYLIRVDDFRFSIIQKPNAHGYQTTNVLKGRFSHCGVQYVLSVTDPIYEQKYKRMSVGEHIFGECFLTISLGERFKPGNKPACCYKLIAAVIPPN